MNAAGTEKYDAIVVGGGHNGLTCAAYLARAGRKTLVLESRHVLGGAAVTEELYPGFRYTVCSYVVSLLRPEVIRELELARHGLHLLPLQSSFAPMENGDHFATYPDEASTRQEALRHSQRDADLLPKFHNLMYRMAYAVKPILGMVPPDPSRPGLRGLGTLRDLGRHIKGLGQDTLHDLTKIMTMSVSDLLDEWFETDIIKALFGLNGIIGTKLGPKSPGTAYVLLHHYMGELDGAFTAWGWQRGGTGGVSEALASAARSHGAEIRTEAPVAQVIVKGGRAVGVALESGEELFARTVVSGCDPRVTFRKQSGPRRAAALYRDDGSVAAADGRDLPEHGLPGTRLRRFELRRLLEAPVHGHHRAQHDRPHHGATRKARDVDLRAIRLLRHAGIRKQGCPARGLRKRGGRHADRIRAEPEGRHSAQAGVDAVGHRGPDGPERGKHLPR
jgi:phytoene dehydrogenase-like protein